MSIAKKIFSPSGPIAARLERYEERDAQIQMCSQVESAIENGGVLLAEAGTGTGKTLAYLVPALLLGRKVVVSTGTKNLQEQIFFKDLLFLQETLGTEKKIAYLKGQDNYLCKNRLKRFLSSPKCLSFSGKEITELTDWAQSTTTGDRMELEALGDESGLWREVCSTKETRIGQNCPFYDDCFVTIARRNAQFADLVIVNHHLYFADLATRQKGGTILPSHDVIIFDEAHLIEDIATEFFSIKISSARVERTLGDSINAVRTAKFRDDTFEEQRQKLYHHAIAASSAMFEMFRSSVGRQDLEIDNVDQAQSSRYHKLDNALEAFELSLKSLEGKEQTVDHCASRVSAIRNELSQLLDARQKGSVYWVDTKPRSVILGSSPIDISNEFRQSVLFSKETVILASATLSTAGNFQFLKSRLGIDFDVEELSVAAPFDFEKQACLFIPRDICDPRNVDFTAQASNKAKELIQITGGGALLLCTSIKNMRFFYENLAASIDYPIYVQGEAPKTSLILKFLEDNSSILVATSSFWQGVDIPGDALRLVIIDKLPFASPFDPITKARIEYLKEQGKEPFGEYQVPQAALSLKQGFGRLIRTAYDRGIVSIFDRRLTTMPYAKIFLSSLPSCPTANTIEEVHSWWHSNKSFS